jgi:hypothetical protein
MILGKSDAAILAETHLSDPRLPTSATSFVEICGIEHAQADRRAAAASKMCRSQPRVSPFGDLLCSATAGGNNAYRDGATR